MVNHVDGSLVFDTKIDETGMTKGIKRITGLAATGAKAVGATVGASTTAFSAVTTLALKATGDLEQNLGGSKAVFEQYAKDIQEKAGEAFKNMGLSASNYLATANKMGARG